MHLSLIVLVLVLGRHAYVVMASICLYQVGNDPTFFGIVSLLYWRMAIHYCTALCLSMNLHQWTSCSASQATEG